MKILKGFCIFMAALFVFIVSCLVVTVAKDPFLTGRGVEKAEADVVSAERKGETVLSFAVSSKIKGKTVFRFKTSEGEDITAEFSQYVVDAEKGGKYNILYLKDDPQQVRPNFILYNGFEVMQLGVLGINVFILGGILTIIYFVIKSDEKKKLLKNE